MQMQPFNETDATTPDHALGNHTVTHSDGGEVHLSPPNHNIYHSHNWRDDGKEKYHPHKA